MTTKVTSSVLANTAVTAGTYGGTANVAVITVGSDGRLTLAANVAIQGAVAGGTMYENNQTITSSYTITSGKSAMSAGPITINTGVTVTIPSGSRWVVL
jgi:hypothetical protein